MSRSHWQTIWLGGATFGIGLDRPQGGARVRLTRLRQLRDFLVVGLALSVVVAACASVSEDSTTTSGIEASIRSTAVTVDLSGPTPVIVDYSPTVSDVGGLMYLLAHPDVEVIAISLPVTGEAGCDLGFEVTLGILAIFGQNEIPVACDPETPGQSRSWPSEFLEGQENLSFGLPASTVAMSDERASDLIARTAIEAGRPVVIYAVAPLTNVARAFDDYPDLADHVERIVIMGGAVDVPGNVEGANAEWNLWVDVPAAAAVIGLGVPVTLVPLDATDFVPIPVWYQRALSEAPQTDAVVYLDRMVRLFPAVTSGFYFMWDELAASVAAGETYTTTEEMFVRIVEGGPDDGNTASGEGNRVTVAISVDDPDAFYANFLSTLAGSPVEVGSTATPEEEAYLTAVQDSLSHLEEAFEIVLSDPALSEEAEFDGPAFAEGLNLILIAMATSHEIVSDLEPPASLEEIHANYLLEMMSIVEATDELVEAVAAATSLEEFDTIIVITFNFDKACLAIVEKAGLLGIDLQLPCG